MEGGGGYNQRPRPVDKPEILVDKLKSLFPFRDFHFPTASNDQLCDLRLLHVDGNKECARELSI